MLICQLTESYPLLQHLHGGNA